MSRPHDYTDLSDRQWRLIRPLLPPPAKVGAKRQLDSLEVVNAIFYVLRSGCPWRLLPHDFPNWNSVYHLFWAWRNLGGREKMHRKLRAKIRTKEERSAKPSAAILDSQSVKTTEAGGPRGYDAGKKINGRKRHLLVDTLGLVLAIVVHSAGLQDQEGARLVLQKAKRDVPRLRVIFADGAYARSGLPAWVRNTFHWTLEIVKRVSGRGGFEVLPKRWIVERTFGWLGRSRRLSKDDEREPSTSEAMIQISMIHLMLKRLCP
ncbi:DDE transposase [Planctomycetales bacterium 10988]|nr:DDE transposase [Planctomycetales bacterium 10988]